VCGVEGGEGESIYLRVCMRPCVYLCVKRLLKIEKGQLYWRT